jgi:hydroxymethylglutaryl-CoA reductase (NADPH)
MAGGVNAVAYKDGVHVTPSFVFKDMHSSLMFVSWVRENQERIRDVAEATSRYGKLIRITPFLMGRIALLNLLYRTGDASGLNMINIASDAVCKMIMREVGPERYFLRSNFSADKKVSFFNMTAGYGKEVLCEVTIPKTIIRRLMRTTAEDMFAFWYQAFIAGTQVGMVGPNAHFANSLTAMFIACGQDVAQVVNASTGLLTLEVLSGGDLRVYCKFPQLIVATVGGGTCLPYPRACLELLGCYGEGKVMKLAEIMGAAALAGEVSICGALASGEFAEADLALRKREK